MDQARSSTSARIFSVDSFCVPGALLLLLLLSLISLCSCLGKKSLSLVCWTGRAPP